MAEQAEHEDDTLELTDVVGGEDTQAGDDGEDSQAGAEGEDQIEGEDAEDEVEVSFDGEAAPASSEKDEPDLIQRLRAANRDQAKKLAAYERGELQPSVPQKIEVGEKPTLESCDYDEGAFETALDAYKERVRQAADAEAEAGKAGEAQRAAFAEDLSVFQRNKTALKAKDFDAAEEEVVSTLTQLQSAIVIQAATNSAAVIYALGKHPAKLAQLAAETNPVKFAAAVARLEGSLKVTTRRKAPEPDAPIRGSAPLATGPDKHLERLEKEADRTGDRTKVVAYKREQRLKGRK